MWGAAPIVHNLKLVTMRMRAATANLMLMMLVMLLPCQWVEGMRRGVVAVLQQLQVTLCHYLTSQSGILGVPMVHSGDQP